MNNQKKSRNDKIYRYIATLLLLSSLFLGGVSFKLTNEKNEYEEKLKISQINKQVYKELKSFPISVFRDEVSSGKTVLAYIGNGECGDCSTFYPTLKKKINEYNLNKNLIYVNGEYIQNKEEWKKFKQEYGFEQTPTLMLLKDGKPLSKLDWDENNYISEKDFDNWLSKNMDTIKTINI